ncbi:DUF4184 family protein [Brevibacillus panacihumi]|uniref:DUF4184 family protein n=1 Tax=Brevibacillus panacihumi TaxID=497735 RepID=UPI003D2095D3
MPFTFAHPAIVLPFYKNRWFSFSALVFGSMSPDFEYFLRMQPYSVYSHTIAGLFFFNLPLVFVISFLFHQVVKWPMLTCLPEWCRKGLLPIAMTAWRPTSWRSIVIFVYSALLGSLSHIVWDSFTHQGAYAVDRLAFLQETLYVAGREVPVFKFFQHGSTLLGLVVIAIHLIRLCFMNRSLSFQRVCTPLEKWFYWICVGVIGVVFAGIHSLVKKGVLPFSDLLSSIVPFLSGSLLGLLVVSWLWDRWVSKNRAGLPL